MIKRAHVLCVLCICCCLGVFMSCRNSQNEKQSEQESKQERITEVRTAEATVGQIVNTISTTGTVFAIHETRIHPKVGGRIENIPADEGDLVAENQVLVRLEQEDFLLSKNRAEAALNTANAALQQLRAGARGEDIRGAQATVSQAKASLEEAESDFERVKKLFDENVASQQMFDTAKARHEVARQAVNIASENLKKAKSGPTAEDVQVAKARVREAAVGLEIAEQQLKDSTILAPFAGIVAEKFMNEGEIVSAMSPSAILRLINIDIVKIQCAIPEKEMSRIQIDADASVEVDAYAAEQFPGSISKISPVVDPASRTFKVTIEIPNVDHRLKPGMFARVQIITEVHENVVLIPRSALTESNGKTFIFVMKNNTALRREVKVGLRNEQLLEILEGLEAGERLIIEGNYGLEDGTTVQEKME